MTSRFISRDVVKPIARIVPPLGGPSNDHPIEQLAYLRSSLLGYSLCSVFARRFGGKATHEFLSLADSASPVFLVRTKSPAATPFLVCPFRQKAEFVNAERTHATP